MLTRLTDMFVTVWLDIPESTVKLVGTLFIIDCSVSKVNHRHHYDTEFGRFYVILSLYCLVYLLLNGLMSS